MNKKITVCTLFLLMLTGTVYSNGRLKNEKVHSAGDGLFFYIESEYELNKSVYVSDESMSEAVYSVKLENRVLKIYYFPRGNKIQIASESTHYPSLVRLVQNGNKLAFTIDLNKITAEAGLPLENIDSFEIKIIDVIFDADKELFQSYLTPKELYTLKHIYSSAIRIDKSDYEIYCKNKQ